jgi:hypothetical protein
MTMHLSTLGLANLPSAKYLHDFEFIVGQRHFRCSSVIALDHFIISTVQDSDHFESVMKLAKGSSICITDLTRATLVALGLELENYELCNLALSKLDETLSLETIEWRYRLCKTFDMSGSDVIAFIASHFASHAARNAIDLTNASNYFQSKNEANQ